ncbi:MFS transporter [Kosakonia sp.]|uniref:MFS transporter n=1 Tax=Kosakonia sp. TaxID=1916651 RepID=UPI002899505C|nr:MFS transporter [Kosakonia sp.]
MAYRNKVAVVYLLGFFLDLINMFIASVAFPAMAATLQASVSALAWVSNGYIAGLTLVMPLSAWLTRRVGARRLFILSLAVFSAAALAAGLAGSLASLIFWRVIQGVGGGLLIPVGQALTWQQFPPHQRAKISSVVMLVALLAPACSPAVGGLLVQTLNWRWTFFATVPVALMALLLACLWLNETPITAGSKRLLHLQLLRNSLLRFAMVVYLCVPGMFIGISVVGMFYLQQTLRMTPAASGALMIPWSLASFIAILVSGKFFNRVGPRPLIISGCLLQAVGILMLTAITPGSAYSMLIAAFGLMGAGGSLCSSTAQSSAFLTVSHQDMPDATALWNINRQLSFLSGATALTLWLGLLQQVLPQVQAWRWTFSAAAFISLLPLFAAFRLDNRHTLHHLRQEKL